MYDIWKATVTLNMSSLRIFEVFDTEAEIIQLDV